MAKAKMGGITIEIEADTSDVAKKLKDVNAESRKTASELKSIDAALKQAPNSVELWQQKQEVLARVVENSKKKLEALNSEQENLQKGLQDGTITEEAYKAYQREILITKGQIEAAKEALDDFTNSNNKAGDSVEQTGKDIEDASKHVGELGGEAGKASDDLDELGTSAEKSSDGFTILKGTIANLAADGIEKLTSELKNATEQALEFEGSIAKVSTIADDTVPIEKMKDDIIDLSNETGIAANVIADATYDAISAGQQTGNAVKFVGDATKLARAGFADTGDTLDLLTTILNAYHMETSDTAKVMDVLIQTQNLGKTSVGQLSSAMGKVIPTANAYSVNLEQIAAGYAIMTANGVATSETTTYINSMLNELGKSGTKASNVLKEETGKSFKELMDEGKTLADVLAIIKDNADKNSLSFGDLWGSAEASKAGLVLLGESADAYNETLKKMESSAGATDIAFEKLETKEYKLEKAQNQMRNSLIEIGSVALESIVPIAEKAMPYIENKLLSFNKNLPAIEKTVKDILPIVKGIGAAYATWKVADTAIKGAEAVKSLSTAVEGADSVTKLLNSSMLANPAVAVTAAVVGLTVALGALYIAGEKERDITAQIAEKYKDEYKAIDDTQKSIKKMKDDFNSRASDIDNETKRTEALWKELDNLTDATGRVQDADKKRAEYILGELNNTLGTEYTMTDNQIDGYHRLAAEIDDVIAKKKAEALLDQYMNMNSEMVKLNASAQQDYEKYSSQYNQAKATEEEARKRYEAIVSGAEWSKNLSPEEYKDYNGSYKNRPSAEGIAAAKDYIAAKQETANAANMMQLTKANFDTSLEYMHKLDDAERAFAEERYDYVKDILYANKDANKQIIEDTNSSLEERRKAYKSNIEKIYADMKLYSKTWRQNEVDEILKGIGETVNAAQLAGEKADTAFTDEFKSGIQEMLNRDKPFDISKLSEWAKDSGITVGEVFGDDYSEVVQRQLDEGYDIRDLLIWGARSGEDIGALFTDEFVKKYQAQLNSGFDITEFTAWAIENGYTIGQAFGESFASAYTQYIYDLNDLVSKYSINSESDARYWKEHWRDTPESEEYFRNLGWYATGGTIGIGQQGIIAEAGPELLQVMNGGIKITPLSRTATNTPVGAGGDTIINNSYITVNAEIRDDYDAFRLAERLGDAEKRLREGTGG